MPKKVDRLISKVSRNMEPQGNTKKGAAIATLKQQGLIRQSKDGLVLTKKGRKA